MFAALCLLTGTVNADQPLEQWQVTDPINVYYPGSAALDNRSDYTIKLLALALSHSPDKYQVMPSLNISPKARNFTLLERKQDIDVIWSMTRAERERRFRPIRIPIFKGLSGWRLALLHTDNKDLFSEVESPSQLAPYSAGQMYAWTDTKILKYNGINVQTGPTYASLFKMLAAKRFDFFPRSVTEALAEYEEHKLNRIVIDPHLLIHYPTAIYFFVHKDNVNLALDIEKGLEIAIADGSFDALFFDYHQDIFERSNLSERRVFRLHNPLLPKNTPLQRRELWLEPKLDF